MGMTCSECTDGLESCFSTWRDSKRFVVSSHPRSVALGEASIVWSGVSWPQLLRLGADRAAGFPWLRRRAFPRFWPALPSLAQRLRACLLAIAARLQRPKRPGR